MTFYGILLPLQHKYENMENNDVTEELKQRGFRSCVATAMRSVFGNLLPLAKDKWKVFAPLAVALAVLHTWLDNISAGMTYVGFEFHGVQFAIITILAVVVYLLLGAGFFAVINRRSLAWNLKRELFLVPVNLLFVILFMIVAVAAGVGITTMHTDPNKVPLLDAILVSMVTLPLFLVFYLPMSYVNCRYMFEPQMKLRRQFGESYGAGMRSWGFIFAASFLAALCCLVMTVVLCLPALVIQVILNVSAYGKAAYGDPVGLPSYFVAIDLVVSLYSSVVYVVMGLFTAYTLYYIYQTVGYRRNMRIERKKQKMLAEQNEQ